MRLALLALVIGCALALGACGDEDPLDDLRDRAEQVRRDVEDEFERRRDEFGDRLEELLRDVTGTLDQPDETDAAVRSEGETQTIDAFLASLFGSVDGYWNQVARFARLPKPHIDAKWVPPGEEIPSACDAVADDKAAFYCPVDDAIHIGQVLASTAQERAGDFAVAYLVAHEYAHGLQQELGILDMSPDAIAKPFELQADCLAGAWAYTVYAPGDLAPAEVEKAIDAALTAGELDYGNARDHGTPAERRDALLLGLKGDPRRCSRYTEETNR